MRDPDALHKSYEYVDDVPSIIHINNLPEYNIPDFDLADENVFAKKYIPAIEKAVRGSFEYRQLIQYMREYLDMNRCSFYSNVNNIDSTKIRIEIHHEPFSLYDICLIVYNKRYHFRESLEVEMVAKEVMFLHYNLMVGLIPLAETVHELVHNQFLFVPTDKVLGKYKEFANRYEPWILPEQMEMLNRIEHMTEVYDEDEYKTILGRNYIYLDTTGAYDLPKLEDVASMVKGRINTILDSKNQ